MRYRLVEPFNNARQRGIVPLELVALMAWCYGPARIRWLPAPETVGAILHEDVVIGGTDGYRFTALRF